MSKQNEIATGDAAQKPPTPNYTLITNEAKFSLGQVVATPGALALMQRSNTNPVLLLDRHLKADWGDICADDSDLNNQALIDGSRLMSVYRLVTPQTLATTPRKKRSELPTVWIITEAVGNDGKRASTCILLSGDY
jgi:hypothetical protein